MTQSQTAAPASQERTTADPVPADQLRSDVGRLMDTLAGGGVAIAGLDVAYAIFATKPDAIKRIFDAKNRSYDKPSGMFSNWQLSQQIHIMDDDRHAMVREMIEQVGLPFSVVAPFREDHPIFAKVDPFVLGSSSKKGTLDMLLNAGQVHDEIARQSQERGWPVFGSSANTSLSGSKYRLGEIDPPVLEAADVTLDYGLSKYANPDGCSSTIIDFRDFSVIRVGVEFAKLRQAYKDRFDVDLTITEDTAMAHVAQR
jgi:tRNA A37 threonylcarbamoyladenosine synthetase subunit TsaC/SUA5/YrdC